MLLFYVHTKSCLRIIVFVFFAEKIILIIVYSRILYAIFPVHFIVYCAFLSLFLHF